jgi:hypothetical protein
MIDNSRASHSRGRSKFRKILNGILIFFVIVVCLLIGVVVFVRTGLDGDTAVKLVIPQLERALGTRISYASASLTWISSQKVQISIVGMDFQDRQNKRFGLRIPKTILVVKLLPLVKRTVLIERAVLNNPTVLVRKSQQHKTIPEDKTQEPGILGRSIIVHPIVRNLTVKSASIQVEESGFNGKSFHRLFESVGIFAQDLVLNRVKSVKVQGLVSSPVRSGFLKINYHSTAKPSSLVHTLHATLAGCPTRTLRIIADLLGYRIPLDGGASDVSLSLHGSADNLNVKGEARFSSIRLIPGRYFHRKATINIAGVKFQAKVAGNSIVIDMPGISLPGLNMSAKADIRQWSSNQPAVSVHIKAAAVELEKVFPYLPLNLIQTKDRKKLLKAGLTGRLTVTNGSWSGKLSDLPNGNIIEGVTSLDIFLENVSGFLPGLDLPLKDASGKLRMNANEILFKRVDLVLATSPIVLNGSIRDLKTTPRVDLFVSLKAEAEDLQPLLSYSFIPQRISRWLGWIHDPSGRVEASLNIKGKSNDLNMKGKASLKNINCRLNGVSLPIKEFNGSLAFKGPRITITELAGNIGNTSTTIKGHLARGMINLAVQAKLDTQDLRQLNVLPSVLKFGGTIPLKLSLEGKLPEIKYEASMDFRRNPLGLGWYVKKKAGTPLLVVASGTWTPELVNIEDAYLQIQKSKIDATGTIDTTGGLDLIFTFPERGIQTAEIIPLAHPWLELQPGGRLDGKIRLKAGPKWSKAPHIEANLRLSHISMQLFNFHKPSSGLTGTIEWKGPLFKAKIQSMRIGRSQFSGECTIRGLKEPVVNVALTSPFFDYTDFQAPPDYISQSTWGEWIRRNSVVRFLTRSHGTATLKAGKLETQNRSLSDFKASIKGKGGLLRIPEWSMKFADGNVTGTAVVDIRKKTTTPLQIEFYGRQLKLERILIGNPESLLISGNTICDGHMEWHLTNSREKNGIYKMGSIDMKVRKGAIHRFEILSKIFSVINFGSILRGRFPNVIAQGLPFRKLTWRMDVTENKWNVRNLELDSDAASINASGMYFGDQDKLDFTVNVAPLVGLDTLLSGLFGDLLTKNGKTVTATFQVRGPTESPEVRLTPLERDRVQ